MKTSIMFECDNEAEAQDVLRKAHCPSDEERIEAAKQEARDKVRKILDDWIRGFVDVLRRTIDNSHFCGAEKADLRRQISAVNKQCEKELEEL